MSGGRGIGSPESWTLVLDLAGASARRSARRAPWSTPAGAPTREQVGQTGKTVSPKLYVAVRHLRRDPAPGRHEHVGKAIVAINKDPDAPIFKVADYGIVGDVYEVLPMLTEAAGVLGAA